MSDDKIIPDHISSEDYARATLEQFLSLSKDRPDPKLSSDRAWQDMYKEFNQLQASKDNKIPKSEFESRYSIFFNRENVNTFKHKSTVGEMWKYRSEEFLRRIDPYRPFFVVDDYDSDKILKVFPPIFREVDTLNIKKGRVSPIKDERGAPIDSAALAAVVNNIFDKYSAHQLPHMKRAGVTLLKNCILAMQDKKRVLTDVAMTDTLLKHFYNRDSDVDTDKRETSIDDIEDYGITYE